jgi:hypothetical protein
MNRPSSTTESTEPLGASEPSTNPSTSPDPLVQILAAIRGIGVRLDILEHRFEYLDRDVLKAIGSPSKPVPARLLDAPDTDSYPELPAPLALRSDGVVLLSTAGLEDYDLSDRERWEGIVLREDEMFDTLDRLEGAIVDAAAHAGGRLPKRRKDSDDK